MPKEGPTMTDDLVTLAARPRRIVVHSFDPETDEAVPHKIRIAPMTFNVCGEVAGHIGDMIKTLPEEIRVDDLAPIIAEHRDSMRSIVAVACGQTEEFVGALPMDQFLAIAIDVFEVNKDFFDRHVGPKAQRLRALMFGDGPTSSTSSPNTDTGTR